MRETPHQKRMRLATMPEPDEPPYRWRTTPRPALAIYCHTTKAKRHVPSPERLYCVIKHDGPWLIAWKCDQWGTLPVHNCAPRAGLYDHPAFKKPMTVDELREKGGLWNGRNGSEATACFKPDSFYEIVK